MNNYTDNNNNTFDNNETNEGQSVPELGDSNWNYRDHRLSKLHRQMTHEFSFNQET